MALDIYVGPLVRYYRHDWMTVAHRAAVARGLPYQLIVRGPDGTPELRPAGPPDDVPAVEELERLRTDWEAELLNRIGAELRGPSAWRDGPDGDYFTDRPGWQGFDGLRWVAMADQFGLDQPDLVDEFGTAAFEVARASAYGAATPSGSSPGPHRPFWRSRPKPSGNRFDHLVMSTWWVPLDFDAVVGYCSLGAHPIVIGSVTRLQAELDLLNERLLKMTDRTMAKAMEWGPPRSGAVRDSAKFGYAVVRPLVDLAIAHRLPVLLDY